MIARHLAIGQKPDANYISMTADVIPFRARRAPSRPVATVRSLLARDMDSLPLVVPSQEYVLRIANIIGVCPVTGDTPPKSGPKA